jgi:hypothetical protein
VSFSLRLRITAYLAFLVVVDVPMYFARWQQDLASGKELLGLVSGLRDVSTRWVVTHDLAEWHEEIAWMSLLFQHGGVVEPAAVRRASRDAAAVRHQQHGDGRAPRHRGARPDRELHVGNKRSPD